MAYEDDRYRREPRRYGRDEDRGFFERAGDEMRAWFGDDDAERRRQRDTRAGDDRRPHTDHFPSSRYGRDDYGFEQRETAWRGDNAFGAGFGNQTSRQGTAPMRHPEDYPDTRERQGGRGDPHYAEWRQRQLDQYDRDYEEYRREHAQRFEQEFAAWRTRRGTQRESLRQVKPGMSVTGSDGQSVGSVDAVSGDRIILTRSDPQAGGHHHAIPCAWIESVGSDVRIDRSAAQAQQAWNEEADRRALFDRDSGEGRGDGPHVLNRSFSGTYRER